jgi:hypothetical protein
VVVGDSVAAEQLAEGLGAEEVTADGVLKILAPIEPDGPWDVGFGVEHRVLIYLDDADALVVEVLL